MNPAYADQWGDEFINQDKFEIDELQQILLASSRTSSDVGRGVNGESSIDNSTPTDSLSQGHEGATAVLGPDSVLMRSEVGGRKQISDDDISVIFSSCKSGNISSEGSSKLSPAEDVASSSRSSNYAAAGDGGKRKLDQETKPPMHIISFAKRRKAGKCSWENSSSTTIDFSQSPEYEPDEEVIMQVKEMIYQAAALRPICLAAAAAAEMKPRRKNVRISSDPQTVAARQRRERVSERLKALQRLVPGGTKLDTASMLDEAANYLKFLKAHVQSLETLDYYSSRFHPHHDQYALVKPTAAPPFPLPLNQAFPMQSFTLLHPKP